MQDAGQPSWLTRSCPGLACAGLLLTLLLALFFLVPIGAGRSVPATAPTTNSTRLDATQSSGPKTWVLSSTVVTSTPDHDAADATQVEADGLRAAPRSTPLIIQVPVDGPTTQPTTAPAVAASRAITGVTASAGTTVFTGDASSPTCSAREPEPAPAPGDGVAPQFDGVGSSGEPGNSFSETACAN